MPLFQDEPDEDDLQPLGFDAPALFQIENDEGQVGAEATLFQAEPDEHQQQQVEVAPSLFQTEKDEPVGGGGECQLLGNEQEEIDR